MMNAKKFSVLVTAVLLILSASCISVFASGTEDLEEIELPAEMNFSVSDTSTEQAFYFQAAADEDGYVAVCFPHVDPDDYSNVDFGKAYIDIYGPDGVLLKEISFTDSGGRALEVKDGKVYVYLYDSVLIYDIKNQEAHYYAMPDVLAEKSGLQQRTFTAGKWEYTCTRGVLGYVKLVRSDGEQEQVLVDRTDSNAIRIKTTVLPAIASGAIWFLIIPGGASLIVAFLLMKKRRQK